MSILLLIVIPLRPLLTLLISKPLHIIILDVSGATTATVPRAVIQYFFLLFGILLLIHLLFLWKALVFPVLFPDPFIEAARIIVQFRLRTNLQPVVLLASEPMRIPAALLVLQAVEIRFYGFLFCLERSGTFVIVLLNFFALILKLLLILLHGFLCRLTLRLLAFAGSSTAWFLVMAGLLGICISSTTFLLGFLLKAWASLDFSFAVTTCQVTALAIFVWDGRGVLLERLQLFCLVYLLKGLEEGVITSTVLPTTILLRVIIHRTIRSSATRSGTLPI